MEKTGGGWKDRFKTLKKKTWYAEKELDPEALMAEGMVSKRNQKAQKAGNRQPLTGNNIPTKTVVFVPSTKGGLLVRKLRGEENMK